LNTKQLKLIIGALLHDIGKILYRYNDGRNHSASGYDFLKAQGITDEEILDQLRYHHSTYLRSSGISRSSLANITYWADNVAAGADRRDKQGEGEKGRYDKFIPLASIFNLLNGNEQTFSYNMEKVHDSGAINYPLEKVGEYSEEIYGGILNQIKSGLNQIELTEAYVNSLLGVLEANLSYVPSSTNTNQYVDISLYDHCKITAAIASCILEYLDENNVTDYYDALVDHAEDYYKKDAFIMMSMDISGIQEFIYMVHSEGALKTLRAKSFYLEIMLEHIIDELLDKIGLSRANLIYSGGGHAYIILPNTGKVKNILTDFEKELNDWFVKNFKTDLYVACGYTVCSANSLMNKPHGTYKDIFVRLSRALSDKKAARYTAEQIIAMNAGLSGESGRECKVCGRVDDLVGNGEDICSLCHAFKKLSNGILNDDFISILAEPDGSGNGILLPFDNYMIMEKEEELKKRLKSDDNYVRSYSKNKMFTGYNVSTKLWIGDYCNGTSFEELANGSKGVKRIGVMRADVDNLGHAFVSGFERKNGDLVSLSRTSTFSRKLNMFFKLHINYILGSGEYGLPGNEPVYPARKATVVYSGGDDLFIIGAWNEIIEAAVDINTALRKYTQGTLTLSAGIGMFPQKYPVKPMAYQTGELEEASKKMDGKNAITVFDRPRTKQGDSEHKYNKKSKQEELGHTYKWDEFQNDVIGDKFALINDYFSTMSEKGNSAIYKLLEYIRNVDDRINLARLAYMLGRMEPDKKASGDVKELYSKFSKKIYEWAGNENDRKQLITAIYIYVYLNRTGKEE